MRTILGNTDSVLASSVRATSITNEVAPNPSCYFGRNIREHGASCRPVSPGGGKLISTSSVTQLLVSSYWIYLSIYGSTVLVDFGLIFSFLIYTQSVGLLGRAISLSQGRYLYTQKHEDRINAHRYPHLEWESNPRSLLLSERAKTVHALDRTAIVIGHPSGSACIIDRSTDALPKRAEEKA
jgi:hypothetical protein